MATFIGSDGDDSITGSTGNDELRGQGGNDYLAAGAGDDTLNGGEGNDILVAEDGNDQLHGEAGNDVLFGGSGADAFDGGDGDDRLQGGGGDDDLRGGNGNDQLSGGAGDDTLRGGAGVDAMFGGTGNDTYYIDDAHDIALEFPGEGVDRVVVSVNGFKANEGLEEITYLGDALPLAYWVDSLTYNTVRSISGSDGRLQVSFADEHNAPMTYSFSRALSPTESAIALSVLSDLLQTTGTTFESAAMSDAGEMRIGLYSGLTRPSGIPTDGLGGIGEVLISSSLVESLTSPRGYLVLAHEMGHGLGLKHPGAYVDSGINSAPYLPRSEDTDTYSIMSYNGSGRATKLGAFDIATLQYLYGVSPNLHSGDTTYRYDQLAFQETPLSERLIGDGHGTDTIDASQVTPQPEGFNGFDMTIDLRSGARIFAGSPVDLVSAPGQVSINYNTAIENAIGSRGRDNLRGNEVANVLRGGDGADVLRGGGGDDELDGGDDVDTAIFSGRYAEYRLERDAETGRLFVTDLTPGRDGRDVLVGVETLRFADRDVTAEVSSTHYTVPGTRGADYVVPGAGSNSYLGGAGNDVYILSSSTLTGLTTSSIADAEGSNVIQLCDGLTITSSLFHATALQLTLSTGATVQVLGAPAFTFELGANTVAGDAASALSYAQFAAAMGTEVPMSGTRAGAHSLTVPTSFTAAPPIAPISTGNSVSVPASGGDDVIVISAGNNYFGGRGDDYFLIGVHAIAGNVTASITDTEGRNALQMVDGTIIAASAFYHDAVQLTLSSGARIQLLGSAKFVFEVGANITAGDKSISLSFAEFGALLGVTIPAAGAAPVNGTADFVVPTSAEGIAAKQGQASEARSTDAAVVGWLAGVKESDSETFGVDG